MSDFNGASTYFNDIVLFNQLGLHLFKNVPTHEKYFVGRVELEYGYVELWVTPFPAMFWEANIFCSENNKITTITTGSGPLNNYWGFFNSIANGMIVIEKVER